ncbi:MAG: Asd/ArgC dimerization domain-containing protein [Thermoanaerobaculia bacterium]
MKRIALVHPLSLVGKEFREQVEARGDFPAEIRLYSLDDDDVGTVTDVAGAAAFVNRWGEAVADECDLAIFCGDLARDRQARALLPAALRALTLSPGAGREDGVPAVAGIQENSWTGETRTIAPAPTALLIARLIEAVAPARILDLTATALLPVSELGQAALDHLFEETTRLLNFGGRRKSTLFPSQVAFNVFPSGESGDEIERQLALIFGSEAPLATIRALQAGLFHGIGASLTFRLDEDLTSAALRKRLARSSRLKFARHPHEPGTVDAAGSGQILLGDLHQGAADRHSLWATIDNLAAGRVENAIDVALELVATAPAR